MVQGWLAGNCLYTFFFANDAFVVDSPYAATFFRHDVIRARQVAMRINL